MSDLNEEFFGELRLGRQLTTASQIAARGIVVILGLVYLLAGQSISFFGRLAPLAGVLVALVMGLTLLNVVELFGGSRERGGTYILVHETIGGIVAFLTGLGILAASAGLASALVQEAAAEILALFPGIPVSQPLVGLAILGLILLLQIFQALPQRIDLKTTAIFLLGGLVLVLLLALPRFDLQVYRSNPPGEFAILDNGLAWLSAIYLAFETLLASRRQALNPGKDLPRAILITLVLGGGVLGVTFAILLGLKPTDLPVSNALLKRLTEGSLLPAWVVAGLALGTLVAAANIALMTAVRQIHALSREGALPQNLRRVWRPIPMPLGLFGLLALLTVPLIIWGSIYWLVYACAGLFLAVMTVVNVATIYSQRTEPLRRRPFKVPLAPLAPALGIGVNLVLLRSIPGGPLLSAAIWLLAGSGYYLVYARHHEVEAQIGEIVFGRREPRAKEESEYRIVVPIGPVDERQLILRLAASLANQLHGEVIPLQVIPVPDPLAIDEGRRTAKERNVLFHWSTRVAEDIGVPIYPITRLARNVSEGIIDTANEEDCDLVLMSWPLKQSGEELLTGTVLERVAPNVRADVAVVAYHPVSLKEMREEVESNHSKGEQGDGEEALPEESIFHPGRILVPTAGGPHAPLAFRIALVLARQYKATVTAVYVVNPEASDEEIAQGEQRIEDTIAAMREQARKLPSFNGHGPSIDEIPFEGRIIHSPNVVAGIVQAGSEYDLVLVGASEESLIDRVLFGSIPEQVARECPTPVVIVKRYRGLPRLWLQRTWTALFEALPTLNQEEQIEVYRSIHRGARPDVDFFVMIGLSALIATFGLLQNSSAVIIGAMLVAPLFSPLLAISLSIVQGNVRLLRLAFQSTIQGVALAIGVSTLLALVAPLKALTPEITSRSLPSLFDLIIALASGAAGAYAIARKDVAAALPGVAIAAALVPPLSVVGIGLSMGELGIAGGGSLLLATNLVAIALAGALTFLLLGFRPAARGIREAHLRRGLTTTVILFVLITIPLAGYLLRSLSVSQTQRAVRNNLVQILQDVPDVELVSLDEVQIQEKKGEVITTIPLYTNRVVTQSFAKQLSDQLTQAVGRPVIVRVVSLPLVESSP